MDSNTNGAGLRRLVEHGRIGIVNRGEPAVRFIKGVREFNSVNGTHLTTVAMHTADEASEPFVRLADHAIRFEGVAGFDALGGNPYGDREFIRRALVTGGCQAVWVGWGFLAEDAPFAELCALSDIVFIGPTAAAMKALGDKIAAKKVAEAVGVPTLPWTHEPLESLEQLLSFVDIAGYPLILKAAQGGGGRGIRIVRDGRDLAEAFASVRRESERFLAGSTLYAEAFLERPMHLEVQAMGDIHGNTLTFGVRDCSIQRNNQKIIEQTPPPHIEPKIVEALQESARKMLNHVGYHGAGTVEFLFDAVKQSFYFMEVNTRLQVEHPITEELYGIDLVKLQLLVAMGQNIAAYAAAKPRGYVVEARLNAEDPSRGFAPSPGKIQLFAPSGGVGIRIDTGVENGSVIPKIYDSMIAKIIATGSCRSEALARLARALSELHIAIEGGTTNRSLLLEIVSHRDFAAGPVTTRFVEELLAQKQRVASQPHWELAFVVAVIHEQDRMHKRDMLNFSHQLRRVNAPRNIAMERKREIHITCRGASRQAFVSPFGEGTYRVEIENQTVVARMIERHHHLAIVMNGKEYALSLHELPAMLQVEIEGRLYTFEMASGGIVRAPSPAVVIDVAVTPGQRVVEGEVVLTLEAMKMQMAVVSPSTGVVRSVAVVKGEQVAAGAPLLNIDVSAGDETEKEGRQTGDDRGELDFSHLMLGHGMPAEATARSSFEQLGREYLALFSGYNCSMAGTEIIDRLYEFVGRHEQFRDELILILIRAGKMYVDIESLFSHQRFYEEGLAKTVEFEEYLVHFVLRSDEGETGVSSELIRRLHRAISHYSGVTIEDRMACMHALFDIYTSRAARALKQQVLRQSLFLLQEWREEVKRVVPADDLLVLLNDLVLMDHKDAPALADTAAHTKFLLLDRDYRQSQWQKCDFAWREILVGGVGAAGAIMAEKWHAAAKVKGEVSPPCVRSTLEFNTSTGRGQAVAFLARRLYRDRCAYLQKISCWGEHAYGVVLTLEGEHETQKAMVALIHGDAAVEKAWRGLIAEAEGTKDQIGELLLLLVDCSQDVQEWVLKEAGASMLPGCREAIVGVVGEGEAIDYRTLLADDVVHSIELERWRGISPSFRRRLRLKRLSEFHLRTVFRNNNLLLVLATARGDAKDRRLFGFVDVLSCQIHTNDDGSISHVSGLDESLWEAVNAMKDWQARQSIRLYMNRLIVGLEDLSFEDLTFALERHSHLHQMLAGIGLERLVVYHRDPGRLEQTVQERELVIEQMGGKISLRTREPVGTPLIPIDEYGRKLVSCLSKGTLYPYHVIHMLTDTTGGAVPTGVFVEYDILVDEVTDQQRTMPVEGRPYGTNKANIVFGVISHNFLDLGEPLRRVIILGDPTRDMGSLAQAECRRVIAALDLAAKENIPVEWLPVSSGARIDWQSGTENLDWTAAVLRRIIEFTQAGGEINVIVAGVNVGAQSYWNAEATMLMHTKGLLIMVGSEGAMLLTGRKALAYSGSVSAESNGGIGGYAKVMGPNGEGQMYVETLDDAFRLLLSHYRLNYFTRRGETKRSLIRAHSGDDPKRNICLTPYLDNMDQGFACVGDIFSKTHNPERKKPFEIRQVMSAVIDQDAPVLERYKGMHDAETAVVWESRLGGYGIGLIGIESRPLKRIGPVPNDGPESWSGGTLFPLASKKISRGINTMSGSLPLVILANLSGFDGSPESMRLCQLEWGAEIGRAVTNFRGLLLFIVIARYHGGAYVVFSKRLNSSIKVIALEGTFASVIGGAPASEVVFGRSVLKDTYDDPRIIVAQRACHEAHEMSEQEYNELFHKIFNEHKMATAHRFENIHTIQRACDVGSIDSIISAGELRPQLIRLIDDYYKNKSDNG